MVVNPITIFVLGFPYFDYNKKGFPGFKYNTWGFMVLISFLTQCKLSIDLIELGCSLSIFFYCYEI